jgi:hypothetical protein
MKPLKFSEPLPEKVMSGQKDTTWRLNDEKHITVEDQLSLQDASGAEFAKAKVIRTKKTTFGNLTEEDRKGHENFETKERMYQTYSKYYDMDVGPETKVKVIEFELVTDD